MKTVFAIIAVNMMALILAGGAIYMAIHGIPNWGWVLFVSLLCAGGSVEISQNEKRK